MTLPIDSTAIAETRLIDHMNRWLLRSGAAPETADTLDGILMLILILLTALVLDAILRYPVLGLVRRLTGRSASKWSGFIDDPHLLKKLADLFPVFFIYAAIPVAFPHEPEILRMLRTACVVYMIVVFLLLVNMLLKVTFRIYTSRKDFRDKPLMGLLQILQVGLFFIGGILIVSAVIGKSPLRLFAGLGASAAILMLVFKDSILGFVSGIQLSVNDMLRKGDWITVPKYGADGTVTEVTLTTVKIQNFDNTIVTLPPYILTSDAFQNWRGMEESEGRRVMRSVNIDLDSVRFCTPEMTERYKKIEAVREYIEKNEAGSSAPDNKRTDNDRPDGQPRLSNLGVFRAYLTAYLARSEQVNQELTFMVRHLQPTPEGLPLQLYFFLRTKEWVAYETIQADIFDHVLSIVPEFDLRIYQKPSGAEIVRLFPPGPSADRTPRPPADTNSR